MNKGLKLAGFTACLVGALGAGELVPISTAPTDQSCKLPFSEKNWQHLQGQERGLISTILATTPICQAVPRIRPDSKPYKQKYHRSTDPIDPKPTAKLKTIRRGNNLIVKAGSFCVIGEDQKPKLVQEIRVKLVEHGITYAGKLYPANDQITSEEQLLADLNRQRVPCEK